jgi:hypothetical protein
MANFNYGTGGSSINLMDLLPGVEAMTKGFFGSPEQMNKNRQFDLSAGGLAVNEGQLGVSQGQLGVSQGRLSLDQAKQNQARANSIALGDAFSAGMQRGSDGFIGVESLPLPEASRSGDLSSMAALLGAANAPQRVRLGLPTEQFARDLFIQAEGDPTKLALGDNAIDYAGDKLLGQLRGKLATENVYKREMFGVSNVNAGQAQLIDSIITGPGTPEQKAERLQAQKDFARSAGVSGGYSPEQKAAGEVFRDQLGLTTPVSPVEGSVAQRLSDMAVAAENAKAAFKSGTYDVNSKEGAQGLRMNQAGLNARQQLDYPYDQDIRVNEAKAKLDRETRLSEILAKADADRNIPNVSTPEGARQLNMTEAGYGAEQKLQQGVNEQIRLKREEAKLGIEYPTTDTAYRVRAAERSGISDLEQYATEVKPVVIPEGGSAMIPQGSYLERNFKPSVDKVALAKQAEDTLTSMTKEELAALPREQLIRLKQAINAGKSSLPEPIKPDNITGRFPTKEEAPKSGQLSYNPEKGILLSTKLKEVDSKVDHEFDKLLDAYENVTRAIEATQKYSKAFGNQFSLAAKIPFFGESAKNAITAKGETAARAVVFDATSQKKHEIYGAALTGGEQLDANNFLPSGSDSADKVREKLQALQGNLYRVIERRMDTFHPYNQSHFLKSYESGRKMIDPASMARAQEKNGARNKGSNKDGANINPRGD